MNACYPNNCICGAQEMPGDPGCAASQPPEPKPDLN